MNYYKKEILVKLITSYRKSKKSTGENKVNVRTKIKPNCLYKSYYSAQCNMDKVDEVDDAVKELCAEGYVLYEHMEGSSEIKCIYLVDDKVPAIEQLLEEQYGIKSVNQKHFEYQSLIEQYSGASRLCRVECEKLQSALDNHKTPAVDYDSELNILKALKFIDGNTEHLYLKEASLKIFGWSHFLDPSNKESNYILEKVCRIIREIDGKPQLHDEPLDDILKDYNIEKEPEPIMIKGPAVLTVKGEKIDLSPLTCGITFSAGEAINHIELLCKKFITVENKTSFNRLNCDDAVIFYLGGFGNRFQKEILKLIYAFNKDAEYLHFGDIDINGFWIHRDLCQATQIPFKLYHMGIEELTDPYYAMYLHPLTDNDKSRIKQIGSYDCYRGVISYMSEHNVKLEQEMISYRLSHK